MAGLGAGKPYPQNMILHKIQISFILVFGLLVGALFVEFVSWDWVFFFTAIVSGVVSISFLLLVPNVQRNNIQETRTERILRFKRIDLFGVSMMTGNNRRA